MAKDPRGGETQLAVARYYAKNGWPFAVAEVVEDGFGSAVTKCFRPDCDLQVVRPGKFQCSCEGGE